MRSVFHQVEDFHIKFGVDSQHPAIPEVYRIEEMAKFRTKFLSEEAEEFGDAVEAGDLIKAVDANLDAIYVAAGNLLLLGVPASVCVELFGIVHAKNMQKVRAERATDSKRGTAFDVVKPAGWTPPDSLIAERLQALGAIVA